MSPGPPASPRISLADYERDAERVLDPGAFGYYVGGAGDELTLRDNLAAWRRWAILPRVLTGVGERDPSVEVLGRRRPHPLVIAPMAFQRLAHPDGRARDRRRRRPDQRGDVPLDALHQRARRRR